MINRPTFLALIVKLAADPCIIPKHLIPAIPTAALGFVGVTADPPHQLWSLGNKDRVNGFYIAKSHIKFL